LLILSRKPLEAINIGPNITVRVISIRGNVVKLGIVAEKETRIVRSELVVKNEAA
jgi:carbon storage regulator